MKRWIALCGACLVAGLLLGCAHASAVDSSAFTVHLVEPAYRDSLFATQTDAVVRVAVRRAQAAGWTRAVSVVATLAAANNREEFRETKAALRAGEETELAIPAGQLRPGPYRLRVALESGAGDRSELFERTLTRWPPTAGTEVWLDAQGRTIVNGKPVFINGFFSMRAQFFPLWKPAGINGAVSYFMRKLLTEPDEAMRAYLDAAHASGVGILGYPFPLPMTFLLEPLPDRTRLTDEERRIITDVVNKWKTHPAILGWYLLDEPELKNKYKSPELGRDIYETVRAADPYHPCISLIALPEAFADYAPAGDVLMCDPYPSFFAEGPRRCTRVRDDLTAMVQQGKPTWITFQAFNRAVIYGPDHPTWGRDREPTLREIRWQACQGYIYGAQGFFWYAFETGKRLPGEHAAGTWAGGGSFFYHDYDEQAYGMYYSLGPEIRRVGEFMLAARPGPMLRVTPENGVDARVFESDAGTVVVAASLSKAPLRGVRLALPKAKNCVWHVVSEGRQVTDHDGAITDDFEPYGARLYSTFPLDRGLPTLDEIDQAFKAGRRAPRPGP